MDRVSEARLTLEEWSRSPECRRRAEEAARDFVENRGVAVWGVRERRYLIYRRWLGWICTGFWGWIGRLLRRR